MHKVGAHLRTIASASLPNRRLTAPCATLTLEVRGTNACDDVVCLFIVSLDGREGRSDADWVRTAASCQLPARLWVGGGGWMGEVLTCTSD